MRAQGELFAGSEPMGDLVDLFQHFLTLPEQDADAVRCDASRDQLAEHAWIARAEFASAEPSSGAADTLPPGRMCSRTYEPVVARRFHESGLPL